jgi:hypothetical protein
MLNKLTGYFFTSFLFFILINHTLAQDSAKSSPISFSGYVDAYAAYYTDSVGINNFQKFPTVSPRSEQMGLNIAMLTAKYSADRVRGVLTIHYGDIPKSTWSGTFNNIQEANAGVRITKDFWIDGGFFRSHIGCEGLLPKENFASSIAIPSYYEPYYEAGFRFNITPTDKLLLNLYLLNGYNLFEDNNSKKSAGLLASYTFNDKISLNYSNYMGDDSPEGDSISHFRFYNNIYANYKINKFKITAQIDFAFQQNSVITDLNKTASMESGILSMSYQAAKKIDVYGRGEIYNDPDGILSGVFVNQNNDTTGLKLWGVTIGVQYKPTENSYVRIEGRSLSTQDSQKIFRWDNENKNNRLEAMINMGLTFP